MVALGLFIAGSVLCALTSNIALLIAGRGLQGCATAAIPLAISIIGTTLPEARRPGGIALVSATLGFGGAIELPMSGLLSQYVGFKALFWVCVVAGVFAMLAIRLVVPESQLRTGGPVDYVGAVLLTLTLSVLLLPLSNGGTWGWTSSTTLSLSAAFPVLGTVFVVHQLGRRSGLIDIRTVRRRPILLTNAASVLAGFAMYANFLGTAPYVEAPALTGYGFGASALVGGLCLVPSGFTMIVLSPLAAKLITRRGARFTLILGCILVTGGYALRLVLTSELWQVMLASTVAAAGGAIAYSAMPAMILQASPASEAAAATGLNTLARAIGTAFASAFATGMLGAFTVAIGNATFPAKMAFQVFFVCGALASIVAAVVIVFVADRRPLSA